MGERCFSPETASSDASTGSSTSSSSKVSVSVDMLDEIIVQPSGNSVLQLSAKHRVLLVFIKWFGCPGKYILIRYEFCSVSTCY